MCIQMTQICHRIYMPLLQKAVLVCLADAMLPPNGKRTCWERQLSLNTLVVRLGCSERAVRQTLAYFVKEGLLTISKKYGCDAIYRLNKEKMEWFANLESPANPAPRSKSETDNLESPATNLAPDSTNLESPATNLAPDSNFADPYLIYNFTKETKETKTDHATRAAGAPRTASKVAASPVCSASPFCPQPQATAPAEAPPLDDDQAAFERQLAAEQAAEAAAIEAEIDVRIAVATPAWQPDPDELARLAAHEAALAAEAGTGAPRNQPPNAKPNRTVRTDSAPSPADSRYAHEQNFTASEAQTFATQPPPASSAPAAPQRRTSGLIPFDTDLTPAEIAALPENRSAEAIRLNLPRLPDEHCCPREISNIISAYHDARLGAEWDAAAAAFGKASRRLIAEANAEYVSERIEALLWRPGPDGLPYGARINHRGFPEQIDPNRIPVHERKIGQWSVALVTQAIAQAAGAGDNPAMMTGFYHVERWLLDGYDPLEMIDFVKKQVSQSWYTKPAFSLKYFDKQITKRLKPRHAKAA